MARLKEAMNAVCPSILRKGTTKPSPAPAAESTIFRIDLAEGEGFEPPVPFRVQWFSRPPPSTTRPSLRVEIRPEFARFGHGPRGLDAVCHQCVTISGSRRS